jgi:hypothetical protein
MSTTIGSPAASHACEDRASDVRSRMRSDPAYQGFLLLRIGFTVAPIVFGLDKFTNVLVDWENYLAPWSAARHVSRLTSARRRRPAAACAPPAGLPRLRRGVRKSEGAARRARPRLSGGAAGDAPARGREARA